MQGAPVQLSSLGLPCTRQAHSPLRQCNIEAVLACAGGEWHWTKIDAVTGMGREAEPFSIDMAEMKHSDLLVEVMDPKGAIASGHLSAGDMYKARPGLSDELVRERLGTAVRRTCRRLHVGFKEGRALSLLAADVMVCMQPSCMRRSALPGQSGLSLQPK